MSHIAIETYGIDNALFRKVCPGRYEANAAGFARIYIAGLQRYTAQLETKLAAELEKRAVIEQRLKDKDEMIELLKRGNYHPITPSAPPQGETN